MLLTCLFLANPVTAQINPLITSIDIKGNRKISNDAIYSKIKSKVGKLFSKDAVQDDIKKLYSIGYFDDVRVEIDSFEGGVKLIYIFVEKPTIISLEFAGNDELEEKDLREQISITMGAIANQALIMDNVQKLKSYYQSEGFWLVEVVPIIREISEDAVALTFRVKEGPKVVIKDITIEGNKYLSSKKIRKVMKTKERWFFSFITGSGLYEKEVIKEDLERIKEVYHNNGFLYIAVSEPEITISPDKKKLYLKISVSEGDQYRIGALEIEGNSAFSSEELFGQLEIATGLIFDRSALRKDIDKIIDLYMNKGYARADINPLVDVNTKAKTANIVLSITEGGIYRIGRVTITGNYKTRDKVIRREMRLDEGDIFNKQMLTRSYQRINNLNYFESVDIAPYPRLDEKLMDINIDIREKLTGMLSVGGEVTQTNLFGRGLRLKVRADLSSRRANYSISLTEPWFMDKPISASVSLYNETFEFPDYEKKATGGSLGFGKELSEYVGGKIVYSLETVEISDVSFDASSTIKDQEGTNTTSSISPSIWRDTRDNHLDPTTGSRNAIYTTVAGLGGDNYFWKVLGDSLWYYPTFWDTVISLRGRLGYAAGFNGEELPIFERFYVGGINTIRGLDFGEAGPRSSEGEIIGGDWEAIFNAEYIFPVIEDIRLKGVVFFDYGGSFDTEQSFSTHQFRKTFGFGARWLSPFGPIRLEWGFNYDPREDEDDSKIEFSMGGSF
jgi:outer membrane protein insertion porin family